MKTMQSLVAANRAERSLSQLVLLVALLRITQSQSQSQTPKMTHAGAGAGTGALVNVSSSTELISYTATASLNNVNNTYNGPPPNASTLLLLRNLNPSGDFFCFQVDQRGDTDKWKIFIILLVPMRRYYFGFSQQKVETAVRVAVSRTFGWYKHDKVLIASRDSDCNSVAAPLQAMEIFYRKLVNVFIGPVCSVSLAPVARYAGKWNIPVITPGGLATELTKERPVDFPTLTVVSSIQSFEVARFLFQIFARFGWRKYVSVYDRNGPEGIEHGYCSLINRAIQQEQNKQLHLNYLSDSYSSVIEANEMIEKHVSSQFAIVVLCGNLHDIRKILLNALEKGFIREDGGEYMFITIDLHTPPARLHKPWFRPEDTPERNQLARIAFRANLILSIEHTKLVNLTLLMNEVQSSYPKMLADSAKWYESIRPVVNRTNVSLSADERAQSSNYVAAFYNAIVLFSDALQSLLTYPHNGSLLPISDALLKDATNGRKLTATMRNRTVNGITGKVMIDSEGNRQTAYTLRSLNPFEDAFETVARYDSIRKEYEPIKGKRIFWPSGFTPPFDTPKCGYDNQGCKLHDDFPEWGIVLIVIGGVFSVLLIVSMFVHRRYKLEKQLFSMNWRIRWTELEPIESPRQQQVGASSASLAPTGTNVSTNWLGRDGERERRCQHRKPLTSVSSAGSILMRNQFTINIMEENREETTNLNEKQTEKDTQDKDEGPSKAKQDQASLPCGQVVIAAPAFPQACVYKGMVVWLRRVKKLKPEFDTPRLLELKKLKDVNNNHVCRFNGLCIDAPNQCIVSEYCPRGSLRDILENEHIHLDWLFKFSLIQDIVRGMLYLHQNVGSHGHLTSGNCLVDTRFVLKIADFGLHNLRFHQQDDGLEAKQRAKNIPYKRLYRAPELLRMYTQPEEGTREGDVYSFAIVCQEVIYRKGAFYVEKLNITYEEITLKVRLSSKPPFRPTLSSINSECPEELVQLIKRCWAEEAPQRPDFSSISMYMRRHASREGRSSNILDNLLTRMEQYANNLESLVAARTSDYLEQKKKAEDLLYMMLPRSVALQLIKGEPVAAESYDSVTVYFSDVCGFTALSASSTPMQVVDFLNDLYTTFDSIIESFDVYKVETIGDAYMVVSGLPQPNGNLHAREIARMAIALLNEVRTFRIAHRPNMQLKLRIGMHTGPVCAGVVGLKMPRYCLFGDTVNTASRMESNGAPLRIHVSTPMKEVLDSFGTFLLELRGAVEMKGKGKMVTWWLLGERGSTIVDTVQSVADSTVFKNDDLQAEAEAPLSFDYEYCAHRVFMGNKVRRYKTAESVTDPEESVRDVDGMEGNHRKFSESRIPRVSLSISHCPLLKHDSYCSQKSPEASALLTQKELLLFPDSTGQKSPHHDQDVFEPDEADVTLREDGVIMMKRVSSCTLTKLSTLPNVPKLVRKQSLHERVEMRRRMGDVREADVNETLHLL